MRYFTHYKNKPYRMIGEAKHTETLEDVVVYECLYDNPTTKLWVRPKEMFFGTVMVNGEPVPRFAEAPSLHRLTLAELPDLFAIVRLRPSHPIPDWALHSPFFSISRTPEELSVVCRQSDVPSDTKSEQDWRAFKVKGPLDFGLTGVLASIAQPLAAAGVSMFSISTFDTDYILVKQENLSRAIEALESVGHLLTGPRGNP